MRRLILIAMTAAVVAGFAATPWLALAQPAELVVRPGSGPAPIPDPGSGDGTTWTVGPTGAPAMIPPAGEPPHEILEFRPSGFWTSNRPATNGSYRWRLLAIGVVLASCTGVFMLRLVRRANAERATR